MPFEPLRFLHAANARLDQAIGETFPLSPRVASIAQDATHAAFERLIGLALDQRVDFLLLAGNTFVEADHSLPARLALLEGLEQLAQESIRVFVLPGPLDPVEAWQQIPDLPGNVTLLDGTAKRPVSYKRDDKTIARIGPVSRFPLRKKVRVAQTELRSESLRPVPFDIGALATCGDAEDARLLDTWSAGQEASLAPSESQTDSARTEQDILDSPVDYLAFGGGRARRTFAKRKGIAHDPGPIQGTHPRETGPRGATLVNVEADGTVRCDFLPTASVRWERFSIPLDAGTSRHDLVRRCRGLLEEKRCETSENAWIVEWALRGDSAALAPFDAAGCRQFAQELDEGSLLTAAAGGSAERVGAEAVLHNVVLHADWEMAGARMGEAPVKGDFSEQLADCSSELPSVLAPSLAELSSTNSEWAARLLALAADAETAVVAAHAQRLGRRLFSTAASEEASA